MHPFTARIIAHHSPRYSSDRRWLLRLQRTGDLQVCVTPRLNEPEFKVVASGFECDMLALRTRMLASS